MLEDKIQELIDATEKALMNQKDDIVLQAFSADNCVNIMKDQVKDFVIDYVEKDEFFKSIPLGVTEKIQNHLEPIFRDAYVTSHILLLPTNFFILFGFFLFICFCYLLLSSVEKTKLL